MIGQIISHYRQPRAELLRGDNAKAKAAYDDFFQAWKAADWDIPILTHARAESAKLQ